jgi:hypothetical protein
MDPAPGYDPLMPHDILHMVVEAKLGLTAGVFGQLAAGGDAGTFSRDLESHGTPKERARRRRRAQARGATLLRQGRGDSAQSERAAYICWYAWLARSEESARRRLAKTMASQAEQVRATCPPPELRALTEDLLEGICRHLDAISGIWVDLAVGEGVAVSWPDLRVDKRAAVAGH